MSDPLDATFLSCSFQEGNTSIRWVQEVTEHFEKY